MGGSTQRPRGRTAHLVAVAGATAAAGLLVGCAGAHATADRGGAASVDGITADRAAGVVAAPTPTQDDVPVLEEDESLTVHIPGNDTLGEPATEARVTLTGLAQADRLPQGEYLDPQVADPGTTFVCLEFKVENTGTAEFDTAPLTQARWTGKDGETKKVDQEIGGDCEGLGLVKENLLNEADPRAGEFVRGTTLLMVPDTQPGALEFADSLERALFKVGTTANR
ncbi:hypothetical protein ACH46N_02950 [Streptomyces pristinaespiralis]|uniref:Uncharacterized protein n=1 Tax=Streptomyces pristinaespiralis TaxID=38300 RepID=A0A0M4D6P2_STRPR|nr:hypothetical protein [Streptomyces pristinaespiralis]ALC19471.1 hypothetical protein SPRI_1165 [Streptomyces pristinaespiralis]QMU17502.1 hypothetical protein H3L99_31130 [Streptomyces pristinaespiralis]